MNSFKHNVLLRRKAELLQEQEKLIERMKVIAEDLADINQKLINDQDKK